MNSDYFFNEIDTNVYIWYNLLTPLAVKRSRMKFLILE